MLVIVFVLGLCAGSFVNMLIYRTALRYGVESRKFKVKSKKRSFCDFCGRQLRWDENIPVISWLIQKGKSKCCHKKLPVVYPLLELFTGLIFVINFEILKQVQNDVAMSVVSLVMITLLIFSAVFDLKYMILPGFSSVILIVIALLGVIFDEKNIIPYLVSAVGASGFLGILYIVTKGKGMGDGDVILAIFMGLFLGWPKIIVALYLAFIGGAIIGIILLVLKKVKMKSEIPFGPMLIMATLFTWYYGDRIWYYVLSIKY